MDTHIWIWSQISPDRLADRVRDVLDDPDNELWLSPISIWEFLILIEKRRIELDRDVDDWLAEANEQAPLREAFLTFEIARESRKVELRNQDPADRFLAATAKVMDLTLITSDQHLLESDGFPVMENA